MPSVACTELRTRFCAWFRFVEPHRSRLDEAILNWFIAL